MSAHSRTLVPALMAVTAVFAATALRCQRPVAPETAAAQACKRGPVDAGPPAEPELPKLRVVARLDHGVPIAIDRVMPFDGGAMILLNSRKIWPGADEPELFMLRSNRCERLPMKGLPEIGRTSLKDHPQHRWVKTDAHFDLTGYQYHRRLVTGAGITRRGIPWLLLETVAMPPVLPSILSDLYLLEGGTWRFVASSNSSAAVRRVWISAAACPDGPELMLLERRRPEEEPGIAWKSRFSLLRWNPGNGLSSHIGLEGTQMEEIAQLEMLCQGGGELLMVGRTRNGAHELVVGRWKEDAGLVVLREPVRRMEWESFGEFRPYFLSDRELVLPVGAGPHRRFTFDSARQEWSARDEVGPLLERRLRDSLSWTGQGDRVEAELPWRLRDGPYWVFRVSSLRDRIVEVLSDIPWGGPCDVPAAPGRR